MQLADEYDVRDIEQGCKAIESLPRLEGELSFPELAIFQKCAKAAGAVRHAAMRSEEYHQQQQCPKCGGVVGMARPVGEEFRTWCMLCQQYRKIVPEDLELPDAVWQMICVELETVYREWKRGGSKYNECVNPQVKRADVLRTMGGMMQPSVP